MMEDNTKHVINALTTFNFFSQKPLTCLVPSKLDSSHLIIDTGNQVRSNERPYLFSKGR